MAEGIVVDFVPVALDKGADEQQQCALWLVKIRHEHLYYLVLIAGSNDNLRTRMKRGQMIAIHPREDSC